MTEKDERDIAFLQVAFPCNNKPFVNRLKELSDDLNTDTFKADPRVRAIHHTLTCMIFGKRYAIDSFDQYQKLAGNLQFNQTTPTTVEIELGK